MIGASHIQYFTVVALTPFFSNYIKNIFSFLDFFIQIFLKIFFFKQFMVLIQGFFTDKTTLYSYPVVSDPFSAIVIYGFLPISFFCFILYNFNFSFNSIFFLQFYQKLRKFMEKFLILLIFIIKFNL